MGFYGNINKIEIGTLEPCGSMWNGTSWITPKELSLHIEQYLRRCNSECMPIFLYSYIDMLENKCKTVYMTATTIQIGAEIFRGFFYYYEFMMKLIEEKRIDGSLVLKDYDPSYNIYDKQYLQDNDYVPYIVKR